MCQFHKPDPNLILGMVLIILQPISGTLMIKKVWFMRVVMTDPNKLFKINKSNRENFW